jgi:enamine deaminase RidA (YjgF/YER057c/UK114 family)
MGIEIKLKELGIEIPSVTPAAGDYVGFVVARGLVFISGQLPMIGGKPAFIGKLGREFTVEQGQEAARICVLAVLAQLKAACEGDLDRVRRCVRLGGFVNSTLDFVDQPKVVNGASGLIAQIFGDSGRHARVAVGVAGLPFGAAVEVEGLFELA